MIINCIAVDDEPLALEILKEYISKMPYLDLKGTFTSALECIDFLKHYKVDLLFLDIQMEELTGIQLLHVLKEKPEVIFTTAYDNYALQGFELDVADYLLKPISRQRCTMNRHRRIAEMIFSLSRPSPAIRRCSLPTYSMLKPWAITCALSPPKNGS